MHAFKIREKLKGMQHLLLEVWRLHSWCNWSQGKAETLQLGNTLYLSPPKTEVVGWFPSPSSGHTSLCSPVRLPHLPHPDWLQWLSSLWGWSDLWSRQLLLPIDGANTLGSGKWLHTSMEEILLFWPRLLIPSTSHFCSVFSLQICLAVLYKDETAVFL